MGGKIRERGVWRPEFQPWTAYRYSCETLAESVPLSEPRFPCFFRGIIARWLDFLSLNVGQPTHQLCDLRRRTASASVSHLYN